MILTNEQFRKEIIKYMDEEWMNIFSVADIAEKYEYSKSYFLKKFKDCFGASFPRYLLQFKLHRAACKIKETNSMRHVGKMAGYSNAQSFSKAFKKEFGISPKQFLNSEDEIADMPDTYYIEGNPVQVEYTYIKETTIHARPIVPVYDANYDQGERGYFYGLSVEDMDWEKEAETGEKIGLWWHDDQCTIRYLMGAEVPSDEDAPKGKIRIVLPEEYYAVISVKLARGGYTNRPFQQ